MVQDQQKLTEKHFYRFFQCPHWIWYDLYADPKHRTEIHPLMDMVFEDGLKHKEKIAGHLEKPFVAIPEQLTRDEDEWFLATLNLMREGKNIYRGLLMDSHWVGHPDLLEKRPMGELGKGRGKSVFGDWYYVVYDIKNAKEFKPEYKFQLVFYSLILERIQGILPQNAYIINADGEERAFLIEDFLEEFSVTRRRIEEILNGEKSPPFLKSGCRRTPWYTLCLSEARDCNDVSLIYGIKQSEQRRFYDVGIRTVRELADIKLDELSSVLSDWPFDRLVRFQNQAKSLVENRPLILKKTVFPEAKTEIYFDVEADPTNDIDYLFGMLVKKNGLEEYKYFWAENKEDEKRIWTGFVNFLASLENFVLYHYAWYEQQIFDRMVKRYGASAEVVNKFKNNSIDLNSYLISGAVLPLYFYGLKDVADYLGFKWRAEDAGGAESVVWYNEWLEKGDEKIREKILKYNEDDVRATLLVKKWLEEQKPKKVRERLD